MYCIYQCILGTYVRGVLWRHIVEVHTVQLDLNFINTRVCNTARTAQVQKSSLRGSVRTTG